ncbi:hypothetical protein [Streptomyces sp. NBC_00016]|uniref:hypothetical protein n=1 Tax=Streptomyces sp. NBC_00016 TaxID=2975622 RepID=UPI00386332BB
MLAVAVYGVPGPWHVTTAPSPITHTIFETFAVAVTVTPPADALAVFGPYVVALWLTHIHIHIGIPTGYLPAGRGLAMAGPVSFMESTARWARTAGSTAAAAGRPTP